MRPNVDGLTIVVIFFAKGSVIVMVTAVQCRHHCTIKATVIMSVKKTEYCSVNKATYIPRGIRHSSPLYLFIMIVKQIK